MPRYRSPSRTPSPSRSPSRGRATSRARSSRSRGRSTYSDGVYSTTSYSSRSRSRSRSYSRSPTRSTRSRRTDVTSSSRQTGSTRRGGPLSHILDTSASTRSEKAENIAKTSLVMLGAIGAATLAAHKFWPKGITYGDKEDWEHEDKSKKEKIKDKVKDVKAAVTGEPRRDERDGGGSGSGSRDDDRRDERRDERRGSGGGGGRGGRDRDNDRDRSRERRERYLEERERYGRPNIARDGIAPGRLVLPAAAAGARAAAAYHDDRRRRRDEDDGPPPPPPPPPGPRDRDRYDDYDPREWRDRYAEGAPPPTGTTYPATQRRVERVEKQQYTSSAGPPPPPPPPPPAAPNPPSVAASYARADAVPAPVVISTGDRGDRVRMGPRDPPLGRYYVDRDTIVIPSRGETEFVVNRAAGPGGRLTTVEREGRIYR